MRAEYQKGFTSLLLLWKGIGEFVARRPAYGTFFGPLTISASYRAVSRQLLVDFLCINRFEPGLASKVRPRKPFRAGIRPTWQRRDLAGVQDVEALSELVAELESSHRGVPILLKQLPQAGRSPPRLQHRRGFQSALDGLIMVELRATDPHLQDLRISNLGKAVMQRFRAYHAQSGLRRAS